jgi:hypothetical protein
MVTTERAQTHESATGQQRRKVRGGSAGKAEDFGKNIEERVSESARA